MTPIRLYGLIVALLGLAIDQALKQWLLFGFDIGRRQPVELAPFLDIVLAWNRGVSYSLFTTDTASGRDALLVVTLGATGALALWLWRSRSLATVLALGLVIGGALSNAYDRYAYGAVADFVWFHIGSFSWYVFNGADVAIVAGVLVLVGGSFLTPSRPRASKMP